MWAALSIDAGAAAIFEAMEAIRNILVPIDFSPVSPAVLELASHIAGLSDAKIWLVHVAAPDPDFVGFKVGPSYVREHRAELLRQEHKDIQAMADSLTAKGINAEALLVQGPTTETLMELCSKLEAGLITMGSHGRGALFRAIVGSVSEQVLRESKVPVLIVPSPR